jgi:starch synthase
MSNKLKILFVSPEVAPFAKTGGLADVAGSLPEALKELDHDIRIITPLYKCTMESEYEFNPLKKKISVPVGSKIVEGSIYEGRLRNVPVYFIRRDSFFNRKYLYGSSRGDYPDNAARFIFFSRSVLETLRAIDFFPDIIHGNDWHCGILPVYLKTIYKAAPSYCKIATLYTVHNVAYHGSFPASEFSLTCLPKNLFNPWGVEFWDKVNFLKGGVLFSDVINTVSEKYSKEIQTGEYGFGLDGVFRDRKKDLFGILNGVDYSEWNPATDKFIASNYCEKALAGKRACKKSLIKEFGLNVNLDHPVIGIISRLTDQKGFDILEEAMEELMSMPLTIVLLGTGDSLHEKLIRGLAKRYPNKLGVKITFDNATAHRVQAGSDLLLMPSRYEPCGLTQIYSLRYGTIPIVRATGGLDDTVKDYDPVTGNGNGFKFKNYSPNELVDKVRFALSVYEDSVAWKSLVHLAMKEDYSWKISAKKYEKLYFKACTKKKFTPVKKSAQDVKSFNPSTHRV